MTPDFLNDLTRSNPLRLNPQRNINANVARQTTVRCMVTGGAHDHPRIAHATRDSKGDGLRVSLDVFSHKNKFSSD